MFFMALLIALVLSFEGYKDHISYSTAQITFNGEGAPSVQWFVTEWRATCASFP